MEFVDETACEQEITKCQMNRRARTIFSHLQKEVHLYLLFCMVSVSKLLLAQFQSDDQTAMSQYCSQIRELCVVASSKQLMKDLKFHPPSQHARTSHVHHITCMHAHTDT